MSKPKISDVCEVFQTFHTETIRAMTRHETGSLEQTKAYELARDHLRYGLAKLELARHIEWDEAREDTVIIGRLSDFPSKKKRGVDAPLVTDITPGDGFLKYPTKR